MAPENSGAFLRVESSGKGPSGFWRSIGAGVEAAIGRNWSVKLEYLYMDLGNVGGGAAVSLNRYECSEHADAWLQYGHDHNPYIRLQYSLHR
jgi:hypothetical protein